MSLYAQIRTLAWHSNITLRLSNGAIEMHNGNDDARMFVAAHRRDIMHLLSIRQRGEHDGRCSKSTCCTSATISYMSQGAHIYADLDEQASYRDGFIEGEAGDGGGLTVDAARETCQFGVCQQWKDAGNAAITTGASEQAATIRAAQVCRECNAKETSNELPISRTRRA
jgi:hypothetical protein